jgi:acetaldehyde dehydrogenase (acetylating)
MTLGCGSWGGNVTSDNVSPIHLMDIKRVAWETKPIGADIGKPKATAVEVARPQPVSAKPRPNRDQIAAIVDQFLSKKVADAPLPAPEPAPAESPVKTVIHELRPQSLTENGANRTPMEFVSETDVRTAIEKGEKIYITAKTILTPSARDLGNEKDVFASV